MNQSGEAAEQIVRMSLEGFEVAAKVTGEGAKDIAVLLYTIMKSKQQTSGKTNLTNMLKSGKELKVFSIRQDEFKTFTEEAKRYGVLYSALINKKNKVNDGIVDIMVRAEDASKINRIVKRFKLSEYKDATIRSEIEEIRKSKEQSKDVQIKNIDVVIKEQELNKEIKKDENSLNPSLAKTEKSPLSEPTYEKKGYFKRDSINKQSVRSKLNIYKEKIDKKESNKIQNRNNKVTKISRVKKNRER